MTVLEFHLLSYVPDDSTTPPGTPPGQTISLPGMGVTPVKRRYVPDPADAEVVKKIKALGGITMYMNAEQSSFSPYPSTMKVQWDGELPKAKYS